MAFMVSDEGKVKVVERAAQLERQRTEETTSFWNRIYLKTKRACACGRKFKPKALNQRRCSSCARSHRNREALTNYHRNSAALLERKRQQRVALSDNYVVQKLGLTMNTAPRVLIEAKRAHLKLSRVALPRQRRTK